jgi:dUTP pyrophosphatase
MKLEVKRIDRELPLPEYQTAGSVAFDLYARVETTVAPGAVGRIPANLIFNLPEGYALLIASRSSAPKKLGLSVPHGIGILDQDFCGPEDEAQVQVYNFTDQPVTVARGERIAQAMVVPIARCELVETETVAAVSRGGFGSTG